MKTINCELCHKEFKDKRALAVHITKFHNYSTELYYSQYYKTNNSEGYCVVCGQQTEFLGLSLGYRKHCSTTCSSLDKNVQYQKEQTTLIKYGVKHCKHTEIEKQKCRDCHSDPKKEKIRIEKFKETVAKHTEADIKTIVQKRIKTSLDKYGTEFPQQNIQIKNKTKQTCLDHFGVEYNLQRDEIKQINSKRMSEFVKNMSNEERLEWSKKMLREQGKKNWYAIDGKKLDSSWEVLVYNYCLKNNLKIFRNIPIVYYDNFDVAHTTFIDFQINSILFEIKGNHLLENKLNYPNYENKLQVWKDNDIIIITKNPTQYHMGLKMLDINKFKMNLNFDELLREVING